MKKTVSLLLAAALLMSGALAAFAASSGDAYTITNPYTGVDWQTVRQYKTALHTHTNASDGTPTLRQSVQRHLEAGFDIVAITDHGTVDRGWNEGPETNFIKTALSAVGRSEGALEYLGSEGTFSNGETYTYRVLANGDHLLRTASGRAILRIPYGVENNAVSVNAHVNGWFADYTDNSVSTYENAVRGVAKAGGLCVINHPGEYTKARYELRTETAYDETNAAYAYYINKFAGLIAENDALIGIDINSKGDNRTRFDRKLWDILLTRLSAAGKNVFAICSSDAHQLSVVDTGFTLLLMQNLTAADARRALETGAFFGASHCLGNPDELESVAAALSTFYGEENEVYLRVKAAADEMNARASAIESGDLPADEDIGVTYSVLDGSGNPTVQTFPAVIRVAVDDRENTVALTCENALLVRFISNGRVIAVKRPGEAVLDLDDCAGLLGDYVRAEVFGEGGMLSPQAFIITAASQAGGAPVRSGLYFNFGAVDFLLAVLNNWREILQRFFLHSF
jgi:hypothetical protein